MSGKCTLSPELCFVAHERCLQFVTSPSSPGRRPSMACATSSSRTHTGTGGEARSSLSLQLRLLQANVMHVSTTNLEVLQCRVHFVVEDSAHAAAPSVLWFVRCAEQTDGMQVQNFPMDKSALPSSQGSPRFRARSFYFA